MKGLSEYFKANPSERRNLEYKQGGDWESLKHKITKAALSMANLRAGGYIIIGVREDASDYNFTGMDTREADTYNKDDVSDFVNKYADPPIEIDVRVFDRRFVVVKASEFQDMPVICKKASDDLRQGRLYVRSRHKNESTSQLTVHEMREIIEYAADKEIRKQFERIDSYRPRNGADPFGEEKKGF